MRRFRVTALVAGMVLAGGVTVGCGGSGNGGSDAGGGSAIPAEKRDLVVLNEDIAPALDVDGAQSANPYTEEVIANTMETLVEYPTEEKDGILVPDYSAKAADLEMRLAESIEQDGLEWTIKLRQGVRSCAGNEFTADDVIYTFERAKSVSGASPVAWFLGNVAGLFDASPLDPEATDEDKELKDEVVKLDDYTVTVKQMAPNELFPNVLQIFALAIYDEALMEENATEDDPWAHSYSDQENAPGFGAYCIAEWRKGSEMILEANPDYYRGKPRFTRVTIRKVPQVANRVAAIQSGAADIVTQLPPKELSSVEQNENVTVLSWVNNEVTYLGLNYEFEPWSLPENAKLRQAIAYALPYEEIIEQDYQGRARKLNGIMPSSYYGFKEDDRYQRDIEKAKQLMAEAGFPNGQGLERYVDGLKLAYTAERSTVLDPMANRIKTALAEIGIPITLNPIPLAQYTESDLTKKDLPMFIRDAIRPFGPDVGYTSLLFYVSPPAGLNNAYNYSDEEFDAMWAKSSNTTGEERQEVLNQMQDKLMEDLPLIPIAERDSAIAVRKGITGWMGRTDPALVFYDFTTTD